MFTKIVLISFLLCILSSIALTKPLEDFDSKESSDSIKCYGKVCPSKTTGCKKISETSSDKKTLSVHISCLDMQDMVLHEHFAEEPNPYGPYTQYKSTSFSGTYTSGGGNAGNININNHVNNGGNNGLEDFE